MTRRSIAIGGGGKLAILFSKDSSCERKVTSYVRPADERPFKRHSCGISFVWQPDSPDLDAKEKASRAVLNHPKHELLVQARERLAHRKRSNGRKILRSHPSSSLRHLHVLFHRCQHELQAPICRSLRQERRLLSKSSDGRHPRRRMLVFSATQEQIRWDLNDALILERVIQ